MAAPTGNFGPVTGTPTASQFAEVVFLGHTVESNTTTKPMNVVTHWRAPLAVAGGSELTLGTAVNAALGAKLRDLCTDDYTLDNVSVKWMDDPLSPAVLYAVGGVGAIATDRSASFNAGVVRKLTGIPSRNYRGSMHTGALPESYTTKDHLVGAGLTAYQAWRDGWNTVVATPVSDGVNDWYPIVLSKTLSTLTSTPAIFWGAWITSFFLNVRIGTMKRRKEKG